MINPYNLNARQDLIDDFSPPKYPALYMGATNYNNVTCDNQKRVNLFLEPLVMSGARHIRLVYSLPQNLDALPETATAMQKVFPMNWATELRPDCKISVCFGIEAAMLDEVDAIICIEEIEQGEADRITSMPEIAVKEKRIVTPFLGFGDVLDVLMSSTVQGARSDQVRYQESAMGMTVKQIGLWTSWKHNPLIYASFMAVAVPSFKFQPGKKIAASEWVNGIVQKYYKAIDGHVMEYLMGGDEMKDPVKWRQMCDSQVRKPKEETNERE
jgi:hypothetical protein